MTVKKLAVIAVLGGLIAGQTAGAAEIKPYVSIFGGINVADDATFDADTGTPITVNLDLDTGFNVGAAAGASFGTLSVGPFTPRAEVEVSYRRANIGAIAFSGNGPAPEVNIGGEVDTLSFGVNALLDYTAFGDFVPYAGIGVAASIADVDAIYGPGVQVVADGTSFGIQGIVGASYAVTDTISVTLDGRYYTVFNVSGERILPNGTVSHQVSESLSGWSVNAGLRLNIF